MMPRFPVMPIFVISGPPGSGKTTLAAELLSHFSHGTHIPIDDLRLWVTQGLSDSVPWVDETERQFRIAEAAAADVACRYSDGGFAVAVDHCRNPERLDEVIAQHFDGRDVIRIMLLPPLDVNLERNRNRKNKPFDSAILEETIRFTHRVFGESISANWMIFDNPAFSAQEMARRIVTSLKTS